MSTVAKDPSMMTEQEIQALQEVHGLYTTDSIPTNFDNRSFDPTTNWYCWTGAIVQRPQIIMGSSCSPNSFTDARTQFLATFPEYWLPGTKLGRPVPNIDPSILPKNDRGGIIVTNQYCRAKTDIACLKNGITEGIINARQNGPATIFHMAFGLGFLLAAVLVYKKYGNDINRIVDSMGGRWLANKL